jgi:hypothetical protein
MKTALTEWCITDVGSDDPSKADYVIIGKPTEELSDEIVVSIHTHHPLGIGEDRDRDVTGTSTQTRWQFPAETFGGVRIEEITGTVQIRAIKDLTYENAILLFAPLSQRVLDAINKDYLLTSLTDSTGRTMFLIEAFRREGYESGGGEVSIDTQWVDWVAYVSSTNCRETS